MRQFLSLNLSDVDKAVRDGLPDDAVAHMSQPLCVIRPIL